MTETHPETLTAALRRLGDERASGVLEVVAPDVGVLIRLREGVPAAIGPVLDVSARVTLGGPAAIEAAAVIDRLIDHTVEAIVGGGGVWVWDVATDDDLLPLPPGLAGELSRRAVDAAQALAALGVDAVLSPGHDVEIHGETAALHAALDGERTLAEHAAALSVPLPTIATWAAALAQAGAAQVGDEPLPPASWHGAEEDSADAGFDSDDEPEPWVMEGQPVPDPEPEPEPTAAPEPEPAPAAATPAPDAVVPEPAPAEPAEEPEPAPPTGVPSPTFVEFPEDPPVPQQPAAAAETPEAPTPEPSPSGPAWNDTAWLDELDDDTPTRPEPVHSAGNDVHGDARSAFTAALGDLGGLDRDAPTKRSAPEPEPDPEPVAAPEPEPAQDEDEEPAAKAAPRAAPNDMAEFLRELSRLALDDD